VIKKKNNMKANIGYYHITKDGNVYSHKSKKFLKKYISKKGYEFIILRLDNKSVNKYIHRLVLEVYLENNDNLPTVNHKDGNKKNNDFSNLEWMTYKDNQIHSVKNELANTTKRVLNTDTGEIFTSIKEAAASTDMSYSYFKNILNGYRTKNIPFKKIK
jgi:hypothetical protein